jgi:hypothetical protein
MARSVLTRPPFGCKDELELWRHLDCKDGQEHGMRTMCARVVMLAAVLSGAVPIAARTVTNDFLLSHSAKSGLTTERSRPHRERESSRSERESRRSASRW